MSGRRYRVEWRGRHAFAELAEALAITTADVMTASRYAVDAYVVLYSREHRVDPRATPIRCAHLRRDAAGVLEVVTDNAAGTFGEYLPPPA